MGSTKHGLAVPIEHTEDAYIAHWNSLTDEQRSRAAVRSTEGFAEDPLQRRSRSLPLDISVRWVNKETR